MLLGVLGKDYGDNVFKYLDPRTAACLECTFTSELVFIPLGGVQALLLSVARRRHAEVNTLNQVNTNLTHVVLTTTLLDDPPFQHECTYDHEGRGK